MNLGTVYHFMQLRFSQFGSKIYFYQKSGFLASDIVFQFKAEKTTYSDFRLVKKQEYSGGKPTSV